LRNASTGSTEEPDGVHGCSTSARHSDVEVVTGSEPIGWACSVSVVGTVAGAELLVWTCGASVGTVAGSEPLGWPWDATRFGV